MAISPRLGERPATATRAVQALVAVAACGTLLGGCTASTGQSEPGGTYTPPAWMAQAAQRNEFQGQAMVECLAAAGIQATADPDGGIGSKMPEATSKKQADAQTEVQEVQTEACYQQVEARLGSATQLSSAQQYGQMVDTFQCLRAQGHSDLGDPPSEAAWTDAFRNSSDVWSPYGQLYAANPDISETEWKDLKAVCVEGGVIFGVSFPEATP